MASYSLSLFFFFFFSLIGGNLNLRSVSASQEEKFSILSLESSWHDYYPPPPPSRPDPEPPSSTCEEDLGGSGSFDTHCELKSSVQLSGDFYVKANGSFSILPNVVLSCPIPGCSIVVNLSGEGQIGNNSAVVAGEIRMGFSNMSIAEGAVLNTTALAGDPPAKTSGVPSGANGDGGGHGGRGATCVVKEGETLDESWGGDSYAWSDLMEPNNYGSKGGTTSREKDYGGGGGGRIKLEAKGVLEVDGFILADGGDGGPLGGGGSGGSIWISAKKM